MERKSLANGCNINLIDIKKFKTNFLCIDMLLPLEKHSASLASLLVFVLKHGSGKYPSIKALAKKSEELYGAQLDTAIRKKGDLQVLSFYIDYVNPIYIPGDSNMNEEAFSLIKDMIWNPYLLNGIFCEEYVEIEKQNLKDIINSRKNNKTSYAVKRCAELLTDNQPYSVFEYGSVDELDKISASELYDFYKTLLNKAVMEIFAIGDFKNFSPEKEFFGLFDNRKPYKLSTISAISDSEFRTVKEYEKVEQAKLSMGFVYDAKGISTVKLTLFLILFAASPNSMLFMNVREKMSLCYYCSAMIEKLKNIMVIYSGVLPEKIKIAEDEILNQLSVVAGGKFPENDFDTAKRYYINALNTIYDSSLSIEDFALNRLIQNSEFDIEKMKREINGCSVNEIAAIASSMKYTLNYSLLSEEKL